MKRNLIEEKIQELKKLLKNEGILVKGFGLVYKGVLQSKDLNLKAKAIYAYLCAFAGNSNKCYPSVKKITNDLNIDYQTFLKYREELLSKGLIKIEREKNKFNANNTYIIEIDTENIKLNLSDEDFYNFNIRKYKDIKKYGFGVISRAIMMDSSISINAKAQYAYLCSLAGTTNNAFPSLKQILATLKVSVNTYYKAFNELLTKGYIKAIQRRIKGKFSVNDYYICEKPLNEDEEIKLVQRDIKFYSKYREDAKSTINNYNEIYNTYRQTIADNIDLYNLLANAKSDDEKEFLENIIHTMSKVMANENKKSYYINKYTMPIDIVKGIFMKLSKEHILDIKAYFFKEKRTVVNMEKYLVAALFNSYHQRNRKLYNAGVQM